MTTSQTYALALIQAACEPLLTPNQVYPDGDPPQALAAAYYALPEARRAEVDYGLFKTTLCHTLWPYPFDQYRPGDRLQDLVTAGQLIVAEIARLWVLRHEQLIDVVPVDLHNECNWDAWQGAFLAAGRADGYSEEVLVGTNWEAVRRTQFSQGVLALAAYRCCYDDPTAQWEPVAGAYSGHTITADTQPKSAQAAARFMPFPIVRLTVARDFEIGNPNVTTDGTNASQNRAPDSI